jgi:cobalt-zinc-cadmium resistance protein CzcA
MDAALAARLKKMVERLIQFALTQRLITAVAFLAMAIAGIWCILKLPVDSFPDVSNVQVQIITEPETMATEEVESLVTFPIENSLNGLPNIAKVRSNSSFGLSVVTAIFDDETDVYFARQVVAQRLNQLELPEGVPQPKLGPVVSTFSRVYWYTLSSPRHDLTELRTIQDWFVARRIRAVPGVANVLSYGGFVKQYQVLVYPAKLRGYGITIKDVVDALSDNNSNAGGSIIENAGEEIIIRGIGRIEKVRDIGNIVLKTVSGTPVKVRQVADVLIGQAFRRGAGSANSKGEAVLALVQTRKGVNTKTVLEAVHKRVAEIQEDLPDGVRIEPFYDQSELVDKTIHTVIEILLYSGGLVVIVLAAILMHIPSGLIVAVIIPLSLLFSFVLMRCTGLTANMMTLGAVDFGVIVDAGVVMVENIFRQLARSDCDLNGNIKHRLTVILVAAKEVGHPIFFAIMIIIAVYLPLFTLEGVEGKMFHPLALTFIYALAGALICSLTIIPVICFCALKRQIHERKNPALEALKRFYRPFLIGAIDSPRSTMAIALIFLIFSFCLVPFLGSEFIPSLDEGQILLRIRFTPSIALTETERVVKHVERLVGRFPEVTNTATKIGRSGMGADFDGVDYAEMLISLKPKPQWKTARSKEELVVLMSRTVEVVPGVLYSYSQPIADAVEDLVSGIRSDLGIKIFGDDMIVLNQLALNVQSIVSNIPGAADVQREYILGLPQLKIKVDRDTIARYELNVADVLNIIRTAIAGRVVTEVLEGTQRFGLLVRFPKQFRDSVPDISSVLIESPERAVIPLSELCDINVAQGTVAINREDGQRRTAVLVNVRGRDLGSFVAAAQEAVDRQIKLPKGYRIQWGGQFENQQRAMTRLTIVVPIVLFIIFVLLFASFHSLKNAGLIMLNVPFALIGGIMALFISGQHLSVPAIIGFIALFGVAVQNGVILVSYIMQLQRHGHSAREAAIKGAEVRFRPVLMTALVAIVGLLPKIFSDGTGAEIQRPLATVLLGGLVSATILTLIVLPMFYSLLNKNSDQVSAQEEDNSPSK